MINNKTSKKSGFQFEIELRPAVFMDDSSKEKPFINVNGIKGGGFHGLPKG